MNKLVIFIVTLITSISFIPGNLFAGGGDEQILQIGLDDAIRMAIDTSEELRIRDRQVDKSEGAYRQARAGMMPHIDAQYMYLYNVDYPSSMKLGDYDSVTGITASQVIWSFGKIMHAVDSASKAIDARRYDREAGKQEVIYTAKLSYFTGLLARKTLSITESSYGNALENKKLLAQRSYGGGGSKYEILRMDTEVAARVPTVNEARAQSGTATETLKKVIGEESSRGVDLTEDFKEEYGELDYEKLVSAMYDHEPSLKSLEKYMESAEANVKSKNASFLPTVSGFTSWNNIAAPSDSTLNGNETGSYTFAGIKISIPIWEGGEKQAQLRQARMDKEITILQKKQLEKNLLLALKKAVLEYRQYRANLTANIEAVRLAGESFKQTQEMFASGQVDLTDLNDAELLLTNQRLNKEMTLFNINVTIAKIEKLIAGHYERENANGKI
ncbi:MAG: TolC family protein [Candidatus Omnitrophota bacterium]